MVFVTCCCFFSTEISNVWWHLEGLCWNLQMSFEAKSQGFGIWIISSDQVVKPFWTWVCSGCISSEDASGKSIEWRWMKNHTGPTDYNEQMCLFDCYCELPTCRIIQKRPTKRVTWIAPFIPSLEVKLACPSMIPQRMQKKQVHYCRQVAVECL